jgi:DNA-binding transcriptional LysR family regulator
LQPALGQIGRAFDALEGYSDRPAGTIRINASAGAAEQILEPMLIEFLRQHPDMRLDIRADDALVDIASGGFDCGLRLMELVPEDMVAIPVGPEQQHVVVAAPLYLQDTPDLSSPADLHAHECIQLRLPGAARYRWEFERRGEAFSVATEGRLVFNSTRLILGAARAGFGAGYITRSLAARDLETGSLVQLLADWTPPYPGLAIYYPRNRHLSAGMRAFIDFVRTSPRRAG